jgi:hypothetical protein
MKFVKSMYYAYTIVQKKVVGSLNTYVDFMHIALFVMLMNSNVYCTNTIQTQISYRHHCFTLVIDSVKKIEGGGTGRR